MKTYDDFIEINQSSWNQRTQEHFESDFYNVKSFLEGKSSLNSLEIGLLGDVKDKKILHLQCHFGMDTISLARMGAKVTGVDLSDKSIEKAKYLADVTNCEADFICCNIFDLPNHLKTTFDIVFTSYGVINWYPDLNKWGEIVNHYLNEYGKFVMVEFHPVLWMFDTNFEKIESAYSRNDPFITISETYTNSNKKGSYKEITWNHGLSKIFQGLLCNDLQITNFEEYDYSPFNLFGNMTEENGKFRVANMEHLLPILFSIEAKKNNYR
ncbi:MAG: class I SAM-dependent methyltransferase [Tannerella forsythia]|uniref:class I SAM-dependent methyltransferase n=1 Tax=Bacteroidales TaxID=171549 RepID=UPI000974F71A|nr:class I SAM-dependent methyltransferase [Porphyromonas gingivalis]SJL25776.1 bifunctional 3-demethylubiquinone-9 3-methyltransferase/ 2-octaprenyl-6-hydroxy phenol methylase [Porphyromonas gingivalis]